MLRSHLFRRLFSTFALFAGLLILTGCSTAPTVEGCQTNGDCVSGERCVKRVCAKVEIPNVQPTAVIEGETQARQSATLKFDGSKSADPDGNNPLTFAWTFVDIPTASKTKFDDPTKVDPSFVADVGGKFIVQLIVTDSKGLKSEPVTHSIDVFGADQNEAPTADAGADQVTGLGLTVKLDGSRSSDPEKDALTYEWTIKALPDGSASTLKDAKSIAPSLTPDKIGKYIIQLVVNDGLESSDPDTMTVEVVEEFTLEPKLSKADPAEGYAGTSVEVVLSGEGFSKQASVLFNGTALTAGKVKFDNDKTLIATLELTEKPGDYEIKVRNPNGKTSDPVAFTIKVLPPPKIVTILPNVGIAGGKYDIKITGSGFVKGTNESNSSNVLFQLVPMPTTITSESELTFKLDLSKTLPGDYEIQIRNPGNRSSDKVKFTVLAEANAPILRVLNPPSGGEGKKIDFSVHGSGFIQGAVIVFNGKAIPSKRIRRDEVDADPQLDLTGLKEGKYKVWVRNPDGKDSNKEEFEVEGKDPTPSLDRVLPFFVYLNDTTTLNIYGQRFRPGIKLFLGTNEISGAALSFKSTSYLVATVDTTKGTWKAGDVQAYVMNSNNKKSNQFKMTVTYRIPSISNITPNGWNTKCDTDVEVFGSNFAKDAVLFFGATKYTTTSTTNKLTRVDDKNLKFKLNASKLSATTHQIRVENGANAKTGNVPFRIVSGGTIGKSTIREIRPAAGRADTKVTVLLYAQSSSVGKRFELGALVTLNGKVQKTSCRGTSYCYDLTAELDLSGIKPGQHKIAVVNPCGVAGDDAVFIVTEAPQPVIGQIAPSYATVGDSKIVAVRGVNFSNSAKLMWGGQILAATVKSDTEIVTNKAVDFSKSVAGTTIDVVVDNGNGKKSPPAKFSILAAKYEPYISAVGTHEFERGKVHNGIIVTGRGFTANTVAYFNGDKVTTKFGSAFQVTLDGLDFKTLKVGTYHIYVEENGKKSNLYPVMAKPFPPPVIDRTNPSIVFEGGGSTTLYIYGSKFCKTASATSRTCIQNPKVVILDSLKKPVTGRYNITRTYVYTTYAYVYGTFNTTGLKPGVYLVYFELPTGERSNPAPITIKPIPPPSIDRTSPTFVYDGQTVRYFYIYGLFFCPTSGTRCSTYPTVRILDDKGKDYASAFKPNYSYVSTSGTSAYVRGSLDTATLPAGSYKVDMQHPVSKKRTNQVVFSVRPSPPPHIGYLRNSSYYHIDIGTQKSYTIYGSNFPSGAFLRQGLKTYPLSGTSTSSRSFVFDAKTLQEGHMTMSMTGPKGKTSTPFSFALSKVGGKPIITRVYGSSTSTPMYPGRTYTLYVYGFNWPNYRTPKMYLNGKAFTFSRQYCYTSSRYYQYCYFQSFSTAGLKAGKHTLRYESTVSGKKYTTFDYEFYLAKAPAPSITSMSPSSATHGWKGNITMSGTDFATGAFVSIGLKTFPLRYSSTTRAYLDGFDTKQFKKGDTLKMVVVNPDGQRSAAFNFKIN